MAEIINVHNFTQPETFRMSDVGLCASMSAAMGTERISCERVTDVKGWIMIHRLFNVFSCNLL